MNSIFIIAIASFVLIGIFLLLTLLSKTKSSVKRENPNNGNITNISSNGENEFSRKYNILVVDDNDLNNKVLVRLMEKYNCNCDVVNSGNDCISKFNGDVKYDLILLDYLMPAMSGSDTLRELKNINPNIVNVIALVTSENDKNNALNEGFNGYLFKPVQQNDLDVIINNIK